MQISERMSTPSLSCVWISLSCVWISLSLILLKGNAIWCCHGFPSIKKLNFFFQNNILKKCQNNIKKFKGKTGSCMKIKLLLQIFLNIYIDLLEKRIQAHFAKMIFYQLANSGQKFEEASNHFHFSKKAFWRLRLIVNSLGFISA